jgi:hypothetical protein
MARKAGDQEPQKEPQKGPRAPIPILTLVICSFVVLVSALTTRGTGNAFSRRWHAHSPLTIAHKPITGRNRAVFEPPAPTFLRKDAQGQFYLLLLSPLHSVPTCISVFPRPRALLQLWVDLAETEALHRTSSSHAAGGRRVIQVSGSVGPSVARLSSQCVPGVILAK